MKRFILNTFSVVLLLSFIGCQNDLDTVSGTTPLAVYMEGTSAIINVGDDGGETFIQPRTSGLADKNVSIVVQVVDFFETYNKVNNTAYRLLPTSEYVLFEENNPKNSSTNGRLSVTVKEGGFTSRVGIRVKNLDNEKYPIGIKYAIPLRIVSSSSSRILSQKDAVVTFNRPLKTSVAKINRGNNTFIDLAPEVESSSEFTVQAHFIFTSLYTTNQTTINLSGYYSRVINPGGIQIKDGASDGDATWVHRPMEVGKWYQITYTYKDDNFKVYLNGELVKTFIRSGLGIEQGNARVTIGNESTAYSATHYLREVRLWNKALTEAEIKDGLYLPVDPESNGLVMYVPMNEKDGFEDVTKYNNKVTAPNSYEWIQNVVFPAETLVTEP